MQMKELTYFEHIPIELDKDVIMDRLQLRNNLRSSQDFQWALDQARKLIHPRAIVGVASVHGLTDTTVKVGQEVFRSRILRVNLESSDVAYPFLVTIGPELESEATQQGSLTKKFFLEVIGDYALTNAMWYIEGKIKEKYSIKQISSISPGSLSDWEINQQVPLFNWFGKDTERLGVELMSSLVMKPRKTISGIAFQSQRAFISCQLCPRDRCPGRRAKYMPEKFAEYGLPIPEQSN